MDSSTTIKDEFLQKLTSFASSLAQHIETKDGQWSIKGFIDACRKIYTISSDTKIVSKILEIHLFPKVLEFANKNGFDIVLADHQNYYPDLSFVLKADPKIKFAVDFKTTYRLPNHPEFCNGFTLGSHGKYFVDRESTKNIQYPYSEYLGHFCLGIIYSRNTDCNLNEALTYNLDKLQSIDSVIKNFDFFVVEKWKIASDKRGSGNTANIGSIKNIKDILAGQGMFSRLGEEWFDDYWMNYDKITIPLKQGKAKTIKIKNLKDFVEYRNGNVELVVPMTQKRSSKKKDT